MNIKELPPKRRVPHHCPRGISRVANSLNKQINQPTVVSVRIAAKDVVVDHTVAEIAVSRQRLATYGFGADLCCEEVAQIFERLLVVTPLE
jgi:hypothetical protein